MRVTVVGASKNYEVVSSHLYAPTIAQCLVFKSWGVNLKAVSRLLSLRIRICAMSRCGDVVDDWIQ